MSIEIISIVISGLTASLGANAAFEIFKKYFKKEENKETIEERVKNLTHSLSNATHLINQIELEINKRSELAKKLKDDIELYKNIKELGDPAIDAVANILRGELRKENKKSLMSSLIVNFVFFLLGAIVSYFISAG